MRKLSVALLLCVAAFVAAPAVMADEFRDMVSHFDGDGVMNKAEAEALCDYLFPARNDDWDACFAESVGRQTDEAGLRASVGLSEVASPASSTDDDTGMPCTRVVSEAFRQYKDLALRSAQGPNMNTLLNEITDSLEVQGTNSSKRKISISLDAYERFLGGVMHYQSIRRGLGDILSDVLRSCGAPMEG